MNISTRHWFTGAVPWLRRTLIGAVIVGATYYVVTRWHEMWQALSTVPWYVALLSQGAVLAGVVLSAISWRVVINDLGGAVSKTRAAQIYLVSQLGKYVPGSLWAYVLQMELGREVGIPRARMFVSSLVQVCISVVAMLALGMLALPRMLESNPHVTWLFAVLPISAIALHPKVLGWGVNLALKILHKPPHETPVSFRTILKTLGLSVASYSLFGAHLWLLATGDGAPKASLLLVCVGAISVGMVAGLLFFILPSGAGARDLAIVTALAPTTGVHAAAAFALASRVMFTVAELGSAGLAALMASRKRDTAH